MKVYIMGPMTGLPNFNREAFFEKAKELTGLGYTAIHTADMPNGLEYDDYIKESLNRLSKCDAYVKLPGWEKSNGVKIELAEASKLGIKELKEIL